MSEMGYFNPNNNDNYHKYGATSMGFDNRKQSNNGLLSPQSHSNKKALNMTNQYQTNTTMMNTSKSRFSPKNYKNSP